MSAGQWGQLDRLLGQLERSYGKLPKSAANGVTPIFEGASLIGELIQRVQAGKDKASDRQELMQRLVELESHLAKRPEILKVISERLATTGHTNPEWFPGLTAAGLPTVRRRYWLDVAKTSTGWQANQSEALVHFCGNPAGFAHSSPVFADALALESAFVGFGGRVRDLAAAMSQALGAADPPGQAQDPFGAPTLPKSFGALVNLNVIRAWCGATAATAETRMSLADLFAATEGSIEGNHCADRLAGRLMALLATCENQGELGQLRRAIARHWRQLPHTKSFRFHQTAELLGSQLAGALQQIINDIAYDRLEEYVASSENAVLRQRGHFWSRSQAVYGSILASQGGAVQFLPDRHPDRTVWYRENHWLIVDTFETGAAWVWTGDKATSDVLHRVHAHWSVQDRGDVLRKHGGFSLYTHVIWQKWQPCERISHNGDWEYKLQAVVSALLNHKDGNGRCTCSAVLRHAVDSPWNYRS